MMISFWFTNQTLLTVQFEHNLSQVWSDKTPLLLSDLQNPLIMFEEKHTFSPEHWNQYDQGLLMTIKFHTVSTQYNLMLTVLRKKAQQTTLNESLSQKQFLIQHL